MTTARPGSMKMGTALFPTGLRATSRPASWC
ncbi:hypothetical protein [Xanthomonas phage vB_XooS_NR08]|nr:hypothetical protein [Xanthomonas phage vB_XooS_NR08]